MATPSALLLDRLIAPPRRASRAAAGARQRNIVTRVKEGLAARAFDLLCEAYEVPKERMCRVVQIPVRTLARRTVFKPGESERIVRLGRLFERAAEVLGSEAGAREWFSAARPALGGATPLDYADTEPGAREVEDLLGRLEHGVFA